MTNYIEVDIAICTFRREYICKTFKSLANLKVPAYCRVRIIVADNDDSPSAQTLVERCAPPFSLTYVHAPARNISIARNACLDIATAPILVFIDDDECVTTNWLVELLEEQRKSGAEVVLGPSIAIYPDTTPNWIIAGDYHSSRPAYVNGEIITGYSCNTLLVRDAPSLKGLTFNMDLGKSGGEDTIFLAAVYRHGGRISYAPNAIVTEEVPPHRANLVWLLKRKYRYGHTHGLMLQKNLKLTFIGRIRESIIAGSKCIYCLIMWIVKVPIQTERIRWLLRGALHAGVVMRFIGLRSAEAYGRDQSA